MDLFLSTSLEYSMVHRRSEELISKIYNLGVQQLNVNTDVTTKELILLRLIFLFPEDANLCYMMGCIFKGISLEKQILWYRLCYEKNPKHRDNLYELCMVLFENKRVACALSLNIDGKLFDEMRFTEKYDFLHKFVYGKLEENYKNGLEKYLEKLTNMSNKIPSPETEQGQLNNWNEHITLSTVYYDLGNVEKALKYLDDALTITKKYGFQAQYSATTLQNMSGVMDQTYYDHMEQFRTISKLNEYYRDIPSFSFTTRNMLTCVQKPMRKIRVGYVSSDFYNHAVSNFILPILKNHDRTRFEIILFDNAKKNTIYNTDNEFFKNLGYKTYSIIESSYVETANLIYNNEIDILIDLNGHTYGNKLGAFAYRPAPIQMTYLGYSNSTHLKFIQYRITDHVADHPESKQIYSEERIYLPGCFLLYETINQNAPLQQKLISNGDSPIILGSLNRENKTTNNTLFVWNQILHTCPNTTLLIKLDSYDKNTEERMEYYMRSLSVGRNRLILVPKCCDQDYNALFTKVDIVMDPFPYSGTTTTCNSLYNSTPLVTLYNKDYHVHNVSSSILHNAGLSDLIAKSESEYISIVKHLVDNPHKIQEYKQNIHQAFMKSMNPQKFMKGYEDSLISTVEKFIQKSSNG
jgi:predicted O-linked N-acetylglucosamine transferase (SPINDLY family)